MKVLRSILVGLGCAALLAVVVALAAPRATHAVVAALVQVTNTTSNPVPVLDVASKHPFSASCSSNLTNVDNFNECLIAVPAGKMLVIQTVSVHAVVNPGVRVAHQVFTTLNGGSSNFIWVNVPFGGTDPGGFDELQQSQQAVAYADPASNISCSALYTAFATTNELDCTIYGYLVNTP